MRTKRATLPSIGALVLCAMGIVGSLVLTTRALALQPEPIEVYQSDETYEVVVEEQQREPYTVDLLTSDTEFVPYDVISVLTEPGQELVSAIDGALDFNNDSIPDVAFTLQKNGTYLLQRLPGANKLLQDYSYTLDRGLYTSITFVLHEPVTGVELSKSSISLKMGSAFTLKATVLPANATNKELIWNSSNKNVAKVNYEGKVMAVGVGKATIVVRTRDGNYAATCKVTVPKLATKITCKKKSTYRAKVKIKKYVCTLKTSKNKPSKHPPA